MAFYLFSMDVVWKSVLSWKYIGVLKISTEEQREASPTTRRTPVVSRLPSRLARKEFAS